MKISVITVCKNEVKTIESTILSVINQTYKDIEYIVVDGNSTDGTKTILNKYRKKIKVLISGKDHGIYDAMNKGISKSSGDWVYFLNAGDTFYNKNILKRVTYEFNKLTNEDIFYGNIIAVKNGIKRKDVFDKVNRRYLIKNTICHQAMFTKRDLYKKYGLFSNKYLISADYEWLIRMLFINNVKKRYANITISVHSLDGVSNEIKSRRRVLAEYSEIRDKYFTTFEVIYFKLTSYLINTAVNVKKLLS